MAGRKFLYYAAGGVGVVNKKMIKCKKCGNYIEKKEARCPHCGAATPKMAGRIAGQYLIFFFLFPVFIGIISPSGGSESRQSPGWAYALWFALPAVIVWQVNRKKGERSGPLKNLFEAAFQSVRQLYGKKVNPNNEFRIPKSRKQQISLAEKLLSSANLNAELANKEKDIQMFLLFYDNAIKDLEKMSMLEKSGVKDQAERDVRRLKSEIQWHLCDALVRQKEKTISEIQGKYRNSKEFQVKQYESFKTDIEEVRPRLSQDTADFAEKCLHEVGREAGIAIEDKRAVQGSSAHDNLTSIDFMEGHQFEHWCAALLQKIGFVNVEVTQGSGDQGVDVLAEKDGIKYAIQCKCYSSDLGNKPIQEVNTGKAIYHCQIGAVITNRYFTQGGKEAARATGVLLWDRDWIQENLKEVEK